MSRPHHWLLHLYPPAWRERYGDEFLAVIEAQPDNPKVIIDVALGALDAGCGPRSHPATRRLSPVGRSPGGAPTASTSSPSARAAHCNSPMKKPAAWATTSSAPSTSCSACSMNPTGWQRVY